MKNTKRNTIPCCDDTDVFLLNSLPNKNTGVSNMICLDFILKAFSSFNSIVYILPKKLNKNRFTWINDLNIKIYNLKEKTRNTHICRMMETFIWCIILSIFAICAWGLLMNYVWKHLKIKKMLKCLLMTTTQNPKEKKKHNCTTYST